MTVNQVIQAIRIIAGNHLQINSFYYGEGVDWSTIKLHYPASFLHLEKARHANKGLEIDFSFYIADLIFQTAEEVTDSTQHANSIEVQSDTVSIACDIISSLDDPNIDWILRNKDNVPIEVYEEIPFDADLAAGVKFDFTLYINNPKDRCQIPTLQRHAIQTEQGLWIFAEDGEAIMPE